jgi:hypothetical protein
MSKRKWKRHCKGDTGYNDELRRVTSVASESTRTAVSNAMRANVELKVRDTSHLLCEEKFTAVAGGEDCTVLFYDPVRLTQYILDKSPRMSEHYARVALAGQVHWRVVFGYDEHAPGSKINADNRRKNMAGVFNFLELGHDALENMETWIIPLVIPCSIIKKILGGWSAILRRFLHRFLVGPGSFPEGGLLVRYTDSAGRPQCVRITASMHTILPDGEGLQVALQWNGASSLKPTFDFSNVFSRRSRMAGGGFIDITCSDLTAMRRWSVDQWYANIDSVLDARQRRERGEISAGDLKTMIKSSGYCVTKEGLLADEQLRGIINFLEVFRYDFMHTTFQDGFMSNAMYLIMESTLRIRYGSATNSTPLVDFLKGLQFTFARTADRYLSKHFSEKMMRKHKKRKVIVANASTQFSMYKLLEVWATEASQECPDLLEHVSVYSAACAVTDVFRNVKHRRLDTASARAVLPNLIATWLQLHKLKYGKKYFRPKFFWLWPIALGLDKSEWLFDMFYVERQHKRIKPHAEAVCNTRTFEASVLMRVLDTQLTSLQDGFTISKNSLHGRKVRGQCNGMGAFVADGLICGGLLLHVDDIIELNHCGLIGCVIACYQRDDEMLVLQVEIMNKIGSVRYEHTAVREFWPARDVRAMMAWRIVADHIYDVFR